MIELSRIKPAVAKYALPIRPTPPVCRPAKAAANDHSSPLSRGLGCITNRTSRTREASRESQQSELRNWRPRK